MKFIKEFKGNLKAGKVEIEMERVARKKQLELEKSKKWKEYNKGSKF